MEQILANQQNYNEKFHNPETKFVGLVNSRGKLVEGGFSNNVTPFMTKDQVEMLCMQLSLDYSMRKDFERTLGKIKSVTCIREDYVVTTTPLSEHLLIEISIPGCDL